ncbi:MAG: hypothetical protein ABII22_06265 [Candidatus Micrarchaeota archaeon]
MGSGFVCTSCNKKWPLKFEAGQLPAGCAKCKMMYAAKGNLNDDFTMTLTEKKCKKCKGDLEPFAGKCPNCGKMSVSMAEM